MSPGRTGIPLDKAELLSTLLEALLYGFSLLMFGGTIWILISRRCDLRVNRKMFTVACLLLLLSTVHLVIDVLRMVQGLILFRDTYPGGPVAFFADVAQWSFVAKGYLYVTQSLIGDGVIIYRCYVLWQSKKIVIVPILLWCGGGVGGYGAASTATHQLSFRALEPWVRTFYAMTFSTNLLSTVLLTYRIWYLDDKSAVLRGHTKTRLRQILHIIVDAGVLYNLTIIVAWICFSLRSNGQWVTLNMIMPIISIAFYMVIIRVGLLPREYTSGLYTDQRKRMQVHITTLTENRHENERCWNVERAIAMSDVGQDVSSTGEETSKDKDEFSEA